MSRIEQAYPVEFPASPLAAFMHEDRVRLRSREQDFGLRWRDGAVRHRAAWIEDTGELYVVQLGAPASGGGRIEVLAAGIGKGQVERALRGWREAIDEPDSLRWLRSRARRSRP